MLSLLHLFISPPESSVLYSGLYDPLLITFSILVAILAGYAALMVSQHILTIHTQKPRLLWYLAGGLSLGLGTWAMHFVGMLSFSLPCTSIYDPTITFLSIIPSILASTLAIKIITRKQISPKQLALGGLLIGSGISAMHYSGMAAMHLNGMIRYNVNVFLLSIVVAVVLAICALWIKFRLYSFNARWNDKGTITSAIVLGLAVSAMHYTAMASAYFIRDDSIRIDNSGITPSYLAIIVLVATGLLVVLTIVSTYFDKSKYFSFSRPYRTIGLLIVAWVIIAWTGANYYFGNLAEEVYQREVHLAKQLSEDIASNIDKNIDLLKGISIVVSRDEDVRKILRRFGTSTIPSSLNYESRKRRWTQDAEIKLLNASLDVEATNLGADLIYVINAAGDCVAASNAGLPGSVIGTNFADRIFFSQILSGKPGHQYAVGRTTNIPGLYYAYPIIENGQFKGGALVKRDIANFAYWAKQVNGFISDSNGVIVMSEDKNLELHVLPNTPAEKLTTKMKLAQYKLSELKLLEIAPWTDQRFPNAVRIGNEELPTVIASKSLPEDSITIHVPRQLKELIHLNAERYMLFLFLAVTGCLLIIIASALVLYLRESQQNESDMRVAATAFESHEGMLITDSKGTILRVNQAVTHITGYSVTELLGNNPRIFKSGHHDASFYRDMWERIHNDGLWNGEIMNRRKNGEIYPEHMTITAVKNKAGIVENYVSTFSDKTTSKAAAEEINNLAFYDPLTQLPNRRLLIDRLQQSLASNFRSHQTGALLFIDLDNFKLLNDTLGHDVGDLLLKQVGQRLKSYVREGDTVARFGGDEFVVLLEDLSTEIVEAAEQSKAISQKILTALNAPYQLAKYEHHSTASIGVTLFRDQLHSTDDILKQADIAMYQAKKSGRNAICFFDPQMQSIINARAAMEGELRLAIEQHQFQLHYQIQVDGSHQPIGAEALIRWIHPDRGPVSPAQFIPLAEESGLILPIGQWVIEKACNQLKLWEKNDSTRNLVLSINVSANQFRLPDFVSQIRNLVQQININPKLLKLELTESMLLDNIEEIIANMTELKEIGVRISLDDFGTGYSSLQYLKRLPLDQLKIDQSFVRDIAVDSSDRAIVNTIVAMSKSLNLDVIAEGVETEEQRLFLLSIDCLSFQGYLFGKPLPVEEFEKSLAYRKTS
jgi:diguanylate cyclase (GGDEF)-like protein/PAS domain S-box-containing protein